MRKLIARPPGWSDPRTQETTTKEQSQARRIKLLVLQKPILPSERFSQPYDFWMDLDQDLTEEPPVFSEERADKQIFYTQMLLWCSVALLPGRLPDLPWSNLVLFVGCASILLTCRSWQLRRRLTKKQRRWREQANERERQRRLIDSLRTAGFGTHNNIYGPVNAPVVQGRDIGHVGMSSPASDPLTR